MKQFVVPRVVEVKQLGEILVAEKPKGILAIIIVPTEKQDNNVVSVELSERAQQMCKDSGVHYLAVSTDHWERTGLTNDSAVPHYFRDSITNQVRHDFDIGLLIVGSLSEEYHAVETHLFYLDRVFNSDKVYVVSPEENMKANLETVTAPRYSIFDVEKRLITL